MASERGWERSRPCARSHTALPQQPTHLANRVEATLDAGAAEAIDDVDPIERLQELGIGAGARLGRGLRFWSVGGGGGGRAPDSWRRFSAQ